MKGGCNQATWMAIYSRQMEALGWAPFQAEAAALNAWEAADDETDPGEAVSADIAYMADDAL